MAVQSLIVALRFDPLIPLGLWAALAVAAGLVTGFGLWRRARGAVWRGLGFAALLAWLAGPVLLRETVRPLPDIGVLLVDRSASMQLGDRARLAAAAAARLEAAAARHSGLDLRQVVVPEEGDRGTRLFAALSRALADIPRDRYAGTIAISDGEAADIPAAAPGGAPFSLLIPARGEQTDRVLRVLDAPGYGIVGKSVVLRVAIDDLGAKDAGQPARLTIRRDGETARTETVAVGQTVSIPVPIRRAGPSVIELAAAPLPGEVCHGEQHGRGADHRGARPAAGAAGLRHPAPGGTHLAAAADLRPGGRSGAFHHPAPAGQGGPHAARPAVADPVPGG